MSNELDAKWEEVMDYARQHATGKGPHTGCKWLEDAFNEYFDLHEKMVEEGRCASFGGSSFSQHNKEVATEKICLELGQHIGSRGAIDEDQEKKLRASLKDITQAPQQGRGIGR